eukprot:365738-Chlamydomonas_euryale.AAC.21
MAWGEKPWHAFQNETFNRDVRAAVDAPPLPPLGLFGARPSPAVGGRRLEPRAPSVPGGAPHPRQPAALYG